jgi:hypothetical protein
MKIPQLTRQEFRKALDNGRVFCWATLYERQDFMLYLSSTHYRPIREITKEPDQQFRRIGRK